MSARLNVKKVASEYKNEVLIEESKKYTRESKKINFPYWNILYLLLLYYYYYYLLPITIVHGILLWLFTIIVCIWW